MLTGKTVSNFSTNPFLAPCLTSSKANAIFLAKTLASKTNVMMTNFINLNL
jgi:hypothetical protein